VAKILRFKYVAFGARFRLAGVPRALQLTAYIKLGLEHISSCLPALPYNAVDKNGRRQFFPDDAIVLVEDVIRFCDLAIGARFHFDWWPDGILEKTSEATVEEQVMNAIIACGRQIHIVHDSVVIPTTE
jgi:hypothetical protein